MSLSERLKELRENKKVSLQTVADSVGVTKPHIWELEKGTSKNPSMSLIVSLCVYYNVTVDYLLGVSVDSSNPLTLYFERTLKKSGIRELSVDDMDVLTLAIDMAIALIKQRKESNKD